MDTDTLLASLDADTARAILLDCEIVAPADIDLTTLQHMVVMVVPAAALPTVLAQWLATDLPTVENLCN